MASDAKYCCYCGEEICADRLRQRFGACSENCRRKWKGFRRKLLAEFAGAHGHTPGCPPASRQRLKTQLLTICVRLAPVPYPDYCLRAIEEALSEDSQDAVGTHRTVVNYRVQRLLEWVEQQQEHGPMSRADALEDIDWGKVRYTADGSLVPIDE